MTTRKEKEDEASLHLTISVNQRNTFGYFRTRLLDAVATVNTTSSYDDVHQDFLRNLTRLDETDADFEAEKLLERCCNVVVENMMKTTFLQDR